MSVVTSPKAKIDAGPLVQDEEKDMPVLRSLHTEAMGKDAVMVCSVDW